MGKRIKEIITEIDNLKKDLKKIEKAMSLIMRSCSGKEGLIELRKLREKDELNDLYTNLIMIKHKKGEFFDEYLKTLNSIVLLTKNTNVLPVMKSKQLGFICDRLEELVKAVKIEEDENNMLKNESFVILVNNLRDCLKERENEISSGVEEKNELELNKVIEVIKNGKNMLLNTSGEFKKVEIKDKEKKVLNSSTGNTLFVLPDGKKIFLQPLLVNTENGEGEFKLFVNEDVIEDLNECINNYFTFPTDREYKLRAYKTVSLYNSILGRPIKREIDNEMIELMGDSKYIVAPKSMADYEVRIKDSAITKIEFKTEGLKAGNISFRNSNSK